MAPDNSGSPSKNVQTTYTNSSTHSPIGRIFRKQMSTFPRQTLFYGPVINPVNLTTYDALSNCLIAVGPHGNIEWIVEEVLASDIQNTLAAKGWLDSNITILTLNRGEFLMPGFVDTHT